MNDMASLLALVARFKDRRILVVGDLMLDRYVEGTVRRISPEAPVPVVEVKREHATLGGAGNVVLNIATLGGQAIMAGFVGEDGAADEMRALMTANGIGMGGMMADARLKSTVKMRILAERQQVVRVDYEGDRDIPFDVVSRYCEQLATLIPGVHGVIIEDYGKGVISQTVVDAVLTQAAAHDIPVGLDPKDNHALRFDRLHLATPNYAEACGAAGVEMRPLGERPAEDSHLIYVGRTLLEKWHCDILIVTLGSHGMYLVTRQGVPVHIPTQAREVFDVSGAGDTVIATTMLALVAGASPSQAALLANAAAGIVVGKAGTRPCPVNELVAEIESRR